MQAIADAEGVPFLDLDTMRLTKDHFIDTHHLKITAADPVSRELVRRGLLDAFRE